MQNKSPRLIFLFPLLIIGAVLLLGNYFGLYPPPPIDYNTDVKPILNKHCISCHGGVKKSGGLSFISREEALAPTESGRPAIIPGKPDQSEMIKRLFSEDPEERMPYEKDPLNESEIKILSRWINQGAKWGLHWSYRPLAEVEIPRPRQAFGISWSTQKNDWIQNDIDYFILEGLKKVELKPSPQADKLTLLRRLSLDLIGLPPPESLARQYLESNNPVAYEDLVDQLLQLPQFGEKWAAMWLDIARYSDTKGFERDPARTIWPYRDWVIDAFNRDLPYDQFLTEQLAGDLLPNPSDAQYIATGFHRNTSTNDEGGTDNEEYRVAAVLDRVNATWEGLMGTSFACTQCHGHPYDPFRHEDYYEFMAFFNNTRDEDTAADYPWLRIFSSEDSLEVVKLRAWLVENAGETRARELTRFVKTWQPSVNGIAAKEFVNAALYDTKTLTFRNHGSCRFSDVDLSGKTHLIYRYRSSRDQGIWSIRLDSLNGPVLSRVNLSKSNWEFATLDFQAVEGKHDLYFTYENPGVRDEKTAGLSFDWFAFTQPFPGKGKAGYGANLDRFWQLMKTQTDKTLIMIENPPNQSRITQVFERGNWLVKADQVHAEVPNIFPSLPADAPKNRLGLAQWLCDPKHPLTSRTMVNRLWAQLFGAGIVETLEDLGTQGARPSHPELLDWMAWRFIHDHQWSVKKMIREIVLSAAYRQRTQATPEMLEKDPYNLYYARASRIRLSAEQIRDQALAISGLLSKKMGGPSVMPYQPEGVWNTPYNNQQWRLSEGEDRYRRSVYTYWKRSAPYPAFITFDAATRELCTARRVNTNTPLQALVTLNDPVHLEAARHFALRMKKETKSPETKQIIAAAYQIATGRPISEEKSDAFLSLYEKALEQLSNEPEKAKALLKDVAANEPETAALTVVANAILNLDELITRS